MIIPVLFTGTLPCAFGYWKEENPGSQSEMPDLAIISYATTFHGLSRRRCTGHLSCCKRYRRDSNTDYISVGQISNLMRYHYSTIPYLIIHHLTALCKTHGQIQSSQKHFSRILQNFTLLPLLLKLYSN